MKKRRGRPKRNADKDIIFWASLRYESEQLVGGVRRSLTRHLELLVRALTQEPGRLRAPTVAGLRSRYYEIDKRRRQDPEFARALWELYAWVAYCKGGKVVISPENKDYLAFPDN